MLGNQFCHTTINRHALWLDGQTSDFTLSGDSSHGVINQHREPRDGGGGREGGGGLGEGWRERLTTPTDYRLDIESDRPQSVEPLSQVTEWTDRSHNGHENTTKL